MISDTRQSQSVFLAPSGQGSKDIFGRETGVYRLRDALDHVFVDSNTAPVKPILDVGGPCHPFQIIGSGVGFVLVLVMNNLKAERVWNKGLGNKSVDHHGNNPSLFGQFHFGVTVRRRSVNSDLWSGVSSLVPSIDIPSDAFNAANVADLVETFIPGDGSPFFSRLADIFNYRLDIREKIFSRSLYIELFGFVPFSRSTQVGNKISIIARKIKEFFFQRSGEVSTHTVVSVSSKSFDSVFIRDFVLSLVSWNGKPILGHVIHFLSPMFLFCTSNKVLNRQNVSVSQENKLTNKNKEI